MELGVVGQHRGNDGGPELVGGEQQAHRPVVLGSVASYFLSKRIVSLTFPYGGCACCDPEGDKHAVDRLQQVVG